MINLTENVKQEYTGNRCKISTGFTDDPVDTVYLKLEKEGVEPTVLLLRPDEMQAIAWVCNETLWSREISILDDHVPASPKMTDLDLKV